MKPLFDFLNNSPILGFLLALIFLALIYETILRLARAWLQFCRMITIRKHGWPPPHIDADGDPVDPKNS
jgi:hypothetical protein